MYGKIEEGVLVYAPESITVGSVTYKPATEEALTVAGYKPVEYTPYPIDGNTYTESWTEEETKIVQTWILEHELTPTERREYAYETEKVCEYLGKTYTCDEMEDLYYKYFAEDGKEDICAAVKAIITGGKAYIREKYPEAVNE